MRRRDFLFLSHPTDGAARLSCEQLYMHCRGLAAADSSLRAVPVTANDSPDGAEWWAGEPESHLVTESADSFFHRLGHSLRGKRKLELVDSEWLDKIPMKKRIERLLAEFRAAGGEVIITSGVEETAA